MIVAGSIYSFIIKLKSKLIDVRHSFKPWGYRYKQDKSLAFELTCYCGRQLTTKYKVKLQVAISATRKNKTGKEKSKH